jgi:hypothetical protein
MELPIRALHAQFPMQANSRSAFVGCCETTVVVFVLEAFNVSFAQRINSEEQKVDGEGVSIIFAFG